ncbi:hypothetical protein Tco_0280824 [Tanacetum coccineum]
MDLLDIYLLIFIQDMRFSRGASFTQGTIPSIPIGDSISPEGFLLPILLLVMIIATVIVTVVVLVAVGGVPSILKLSFMVIGFFLGTLLLYQESFKSRPGVFLGPEFLLGLLIIAIVAACASRAVATLSATSFLMACFRDELDNVVEEEDREYICFLGGNNLSGTKKYWGSNSSDGGNTGDGVKITGGVIGSGGGIESFEELKEVLPDVGDEVEV